MAPACRPGCAKNGISPAPRNQPEERAAPFRNLTDLSRRSPKGYAKSGYVGPNQPWGSVEKWFELENHRRPQFKPFLQDIEHSAHDVLIPDIKKLSGLTDDELFITYQSQLERLRGKKLLHIVGEYDKGHWIEGGEKALEFRREVYAFNRFKPYADALRLIVVPNLTHYGHVESYNEGTGESDGDRFQRIFSRLTCLAMPTVTNCPGRANFLRNMSKGVRTTVRHNLTH